MASEIVKQHSFIAPVANIQDALMRYQAVKDFIGEVLAEGVDYGGFPGSDKPVLLKPGAEKMCAFFGFDTRFILEDKVEDWTGEEHNGEPFFYYRYRAQLWRGDRMVAEGEGSCNSWEKKYRYRKAERVCPACGQATIIKGKAEYGGGWLCWGKKGGCGAKYPDGAPEIEGQEAGQVLNPDPAEQVNTYQKMAQKRALVAPVLIATNTSDYFTQDIEDYNVVDAVLREVESAGHTVKVTETPIPLYTEKRPMTPEQVKLFVEEKAKEYAKSQIKPIDQKLLGAFVGQLNTIFGSDEYRYAVCKHLTGGGSSKEIPAHYMRALWAWVDNTKDPETGDWIPNQYITKEAHDLIEYVMKEQGQLEFPE